MDLKFDAMTLVDTSLAKEYIQQVSREMSDKSQRIYYNGKTYCDDLEQTKEIDTPKYQSNCLKLEALAIKLKKYTNLITQLEYSVRNIPIEDTTVQINLIIKQLLYVARETNINTFKTPFSEISMSSDSPLCHLGSTIKNLALSKTQLINVHESTQTVSYLFTTLCVAAGLQIYMRVRAYTDEDCLWRYMTVSAVAVISEFSDLDSAVDVFFSSSKQVPWSIQKILVQESVFEQFKSAVSWKRKLPWVAEAYRTRRELLARLRDLAPHCVALWASDVAEVNEIAHRVSAPLVWVNTFGDFRGPPRVSEAMYPFYCQSYFDPLLIQDKPIHDIFTLKQSWLQLDLESRREILCNALTELSTLEPSNKLYEQIQNEIRKVDPRAAGTFIDVGKDYVCIGLPAPAKVLIRLKNYTPTTAFYTSLLLGNAFCFDNISETVSDVFQKARIPVVLTCKKLKTYHNMGNWIYDCDDLAEITPVTKVIWTNSGTIIDN